MQRTRLAAVSSERGRAGTVYTVDPVLQLDLAGRLEQVRVAEGRAEAEDVVPLRMLRYRLHDRTVDDDQMLRGGLDRAALARIARIEQQGRTLQAHPVALPAALAGQLDLVLLAQQPLLHRQEAAGEAKRKGRAMVRTWVQGDRFAQRYLPRLSHSASTVEGGGRRTGRLRFVR